MSTDADGWYAPGPTSPPASPEGVAGLTAKLTAAGVEAQSARALARWLGTAPDEEVRCVRAEALPEALGGPEPLELLFRAHDAGAVVAGFAMVCDWCGGIAGGAARLCELGRSFYCGTCQAEADVELDATVEVVFRLSPTFRPLPLSEPERLPPGVALRLHRYHPHGHVAGEPALAVLHRQTRALTTLAPGARLELPLEGAAHKDVLELVTTPQGASHFTIVDERAVARRSEATWVGGAFDVVERKVAPGRSVVVVENRGEAPLGLFAYWMPKSRGTFQPVRLARSTEARELYLKPWARARYAALLEPLASLTVRDVTVWFSDVQGSTELYEHAGDLEAYVRIQEHFAAVERVVVAGGGAVIKTLGDAVMAAFPSPGAAARAARAAMEAKAGGFSIRIGMFRGPVLAVRANGVPDLFGQTVNVAARLQAIASPGELCAGEALLDEPEVAEALAGAPCSRHEARLKGVSRPVLVRRYAFAS